MKKKHILIFSIILIILLFGSFATYWYFNNQKKQAMILEKENRQKKLKEINSHYAQNVITVKKANLYEKVEGKYRKVGSVAKNIALTLKTQKITENTKYFQLQNNNFYISYQNVQKNQNQKEIDNRYKNYIPFDEILTTKANGSLYQNDKVVYQLKDPIVESIIEKTNQGYKIEYDDQLFEVLFSDVAKVEEKENLQLEVASSIPVTVYHFIYLEGDTGCNEEICHSEKQIREQFQYLKEQKYLTITTLEMEKFIKGKIRLPKNSILITIDDGARAENFIPLLEEYQLHATLFLITSWYSIDKFSSPYLELASHSHNLHTPGVCAGGQGSPLKCMDMDELVQDLTTSRQILNTQAFCFPFYEYNDHAIEAIRKAGFTMGFIGGQKKASVGVDPYKIPRITIHHNTSLEEYQQYLAS